MEREVLATAKFFVASCDEKYTATLELVPSGCFPYGNKHAVIFKRYEDGKQVGVDCYDARYNSKFDTEETFAENALEFVKKYFRDDFTIEQIA